ncbi:hypothetical protein ACPV5P_25515, partial [Vibrio mediterranei]
AYQFQQLTAFLILHMKCRTYYLNSGSIAVLAKDEQHALDIASELNAVKLGFANVNVIKLGFKLSL